MSPMFPREVFFTENNKPRTRSLFYDFHVHGTMNQAVFTIKPYDDKGYVSLRKLFLQYVPDDPSEVTFAEIVFGDFQTWETISQAPAVKPFVEKWRYVADVKRKSEAFGVIVAEAKENKNYHAAKYLIEEPWKKSNSKTKDTKETTAQAFTAVEDDVSRLIEQGMLN